MVYPDDQQTADAATYLWVAETVLRKHHRPLKAREIVNFGIEDGLFADREISKTPQKSMQARLSIDILEKGLDSKFLRTGRGLFFLRELLHGLQQTESGEYTAVRRHPAPASENVLTIGRAGYEDVLDFQGIDVLHADRLRKLLSSPHLKYMPRTAAELDNDYKQFVTYTIIQSQTRILCFRRGEYNRAANFLRGALCVGFGGHVTENDLSIFSYQDQGIRATAAREIAEEIRFKIGRPEIDATAIEVMGILNDDSECFRDGAGYVEVNSGRVLARLMGIAPVPETPRTRFQDDAQAFISTNFGPTVLAYAILEEAKRAGTGRVIVDGVRHPETLKALRENAKCPVAALYIHTPPDVAYELYTVREAPSEPLSPAQFAAIQNAPVESNVRYLIDEADAIVYNWFGIDSYRFVIRELIAELGLLSHEYHRRRI